MKRFRATVLIGLGLLAPSLAHAGAVGEAAMRFLQAVSAGEVLAQSEFAAAVSAEDALILKGLAGCEPGQPRFGSGEPSALILWDCSGQPGRNSKSTLLLFKDGRLESIFIMSAVIVPREAAD